MLPAPIPAEEIRWVVTERAADPDEVRSNLAGAFRLRTEDQRAGTPGLRVPQAGAVHAVLAHWSTGSVEPATVVLPTGTGKTETMVALFASERFERLLVVVPSDNLRAQIAQKFESYGVLPDAGVLDATAPFPVVGRIEHHFESAASARSFMSRCNVVVATPAALAASADDIVAAIVAQCTHLFVDEAHHVAAQSWARIRDAFAGKPVVQFTATPYRADGERLGGRVIYSFPLGRAQQLGYFQPITYVSVVALTSPDRAVARAAIATLRADREAGLDHLIMARVRSIPRAEDTVLPIYRDLASDFEPVVLHSKLPAKARAAALKAIRDRSSRIVVCVDMLGEGFDFPELKIAALHDPHRSLGVALQFIGRFARSRSDLGNATAVVARPEPGYDERLRALYAEGLEWDVVIERLAGEAIEQVREADEFEAGFARAEADAVSLHTLQPKMSTVVYETHCSEWTPHRLSDLYPQESIVSPPSINADERVAWMVVEVRSNIRWGEVKSLQNVDFHLHVLHWDRARGLLYINTSELESLHEDIAHAVCGDDARLVTGQRVYRALAELQRPTPTNVGLISLRNRSRRFSMFVGADVYEGLPAAMEEDKTNTNIFIIGYLEGDRITRGAARKGRIWSQQAASSILEWVRWCRRIGPLLQDDTVSLDALLRGFVRPKPLDARPELAPLAIDWPELAYAGFSSSSKIDINGTEALLIDAELVLTDHSTTGPIKFDVCVEDQRAAFEANVEDGRLRYRLVDGIAQVVRKRADAEPLSAFLDREGVTIWFENEIAIETSVMYELERPHQPINPDRLLALDWKGIDITRESQGRDRDEKTVQARAAAHLTSLGPWDVLIDDDGSGEIADLVALRQEADRIIVHLVHCKYSASKTPRPRVDDLYTVCGQAHRSAHHRQHVPDMVTNLVRRETARRARGRSGLMIGDDQALTDLQDAVRSRRPEFRVTVVQPGFPKSQALPRHLQILGAADVYVAEVAYGKFDVWCSA